LIPEEIKQGLALVDKQGAIVQVEVVPTAKIRSRFYQAKPFLQAVLLWAMAQPAVQ
jgi:hypothetical protein